MTSVSVQYDNVVHLRHFSFDLSKRGQQFLAIQIILINSIISFFCLVRKQLFTEFYVLSQKRTITLFSFKKKLLIKHVIFKLSLSMKYSCSDTT